jgi:hypothetical protein
MKKLVITCLSLCVNGIKSCVLLFFLIEEVTAGDETRSDIKKSHEQQELAEDEIQEESESLLDAINKITLIKSC